MKSSVSRAIGLATVILMFFVGIITYPQMPEMMASHWNINGQANGFMPKFWGIFIFPLIALAMYLLFILIPKMDPKRKNIEKFRAYYDNFILMMLVFFFYIFAMSITWNYGISYNFNQAIVPPFTLLFYYIGVMLEHAEPNWTIGIRTPWTLENETVWKNTHKLGSQLFKISALLGLIGIFLPQYSLLFILIPIIASAVFITAYSYFIFPREKPAKKTKK